jgi:alpha-beta hydrolase superfamily lysophospholipase
MVGRRDEGFFAGRDSTRLYWQSLMPQGEFKDVVGIVHGFGDHSGRYRRVSEALIADGHAVLAFDYRGHGKADGRRGHCTSWTEFVEDLAVFWVRVRQLASGRPTFLLAHSHGALMSMHFAARKPEGLRGVAMTAPYFRLAKEPKAITVLGAKVLSTIAPIFPVPMGLTVEMLSRDQAWQKETAEDPLYGKMTTARWAAAHFAAQQQLLTLGSQITVPVLMLAGDSDEIASTSAAKAFFDTLASPDKQFKLYPGMRHEIMSETGKEEVWSDISRWISAHR